MKLFDRNAYLEPEDQPVTQGTMPKTELAELLGRASKRVQVFRELYYKREPFYMQ